MPHSFQVSIFIEIRLKLKEKLPENNLGTYLTQLEIPNIEIYAKTGIPTVELSKLRSGRITRLSAKKLYFISLAAGKDIGDTLKEVFPTLAIADTKPVKSNSKKYTEIGNYLNSIERDTIEAISRKTSITVSRLRDLKTKSNVIALAEELYSIELATNKNPGDLYKMMFANVRLNSKDEQAKLLKEEKDKSLVKALKSKKSK